MSTLMLADLDCATRRALDLAPECDHDRDRTIAFIPIVEIAAPFASDPCIDQPGVAWMRTGLHVEPIPPSGGLRKESARSRSRPPPWSARR